MKINSGFSLVELMIVIVIIGVLAAVAVPIYSNNILKAKMSEADGALGGIRTKLRVYYGENGEYPDATDAYVIDEFWHVMPEGELTGKYFYDSSYTVTSSADLGTYTIKCSKGNILKSDRTLDEGGNLSGGL